MSSSPVIREFASKHVNLKLKRCRQSRAPYKCAPRAAPAQSLASIVSRRGLWQNAGTATFRQQRPPARDAVATPSHRSFHVAEDRSCSRRRSFPAARAVTLLKIHRRATCLYNPLRLSRLEVGSQLKLQRETAAVSKFPACWKGSHVAHCLCVCLKRPRNPWPVR